MLIGCVFRFVEGMIQRGEKMKPVVTAKPFSSPCVRNCCLDDNDVCLGCYRSIKEIMQWSNMSDAEKSATLDKSQSRQELARQKHIEFG
jgi:predicted Fe-S protein YdhL (DUF1289 family)